jgi:hypothetical protein
MMQHYAMPQQGMPQQGMMGAQAVPPAPHMQQLERRAADIAPEPKSLLAKLLKRSPKPAEASLAAPNLAMQTPNFEAAMPSAEQFQPPLKSSGSLLNKNFALGAVTGLIVGAFVLPLLINMVLGDTTSQAQAQAKSGAVAQAESMTEFDPNAPAIEEGETFLDAAIGTEAP